MIKKRKKTRITPELREVAEKVPESGDDGSGIDREKVVVLFKRQTRGLRPTLLIMKS